MKITVKTLQDRIDYLNNITSHLNGADVFVVLGENSVYRLVIRHENNTITDISPNLSKTSLHAWINAWIDGYLFHVLKTN